MNFELRTYIGLRFGVLNDLYSIFIFNIVLLLQLIRFFKNAK
jgi:uncharacterized membrane protein YcgQ (UPF0703/DUF1980 family)